MLCLVRDLLDLLYVATLWRNVTEKGNKPDVTKKCCCIDVSYSEDYKDAHEV